MEEKAPESPRSGIADRSIQGFRIYIVRNAFPRPTVFRYRLVNMEKLLADSVKILSLPSQAKKIYTENGTLVKEISEMAEDETYVISCGEKFISAVRTPTKAKKVETNEEEDDEISQTLLKRKEDASKDDIKSTASNGQSRREKELQSFHRLIALSPKTVEDQFIESTLAAFCSTEPDMKAKLSNFDDLTNLMNNVQYNDFISHLISNGVSPSFATSPIQDEVDQYVIDLSKALSIQNLQFIVSGMPQTGKSAMLYSMATILFRKIQQSSANGCFLFFPLNAEKLTLELQSSRKIYNAFVINTFTALRYCNYALAPFTKQLESWFLSIPGSAIIAAFPTVPEHVHGVDFKAMQEFGRRVFDVAHNTTGLKDFLDITCELPSAIARAAGLPRVFFVIDHFDYFNTEVHEPEVFPDSLRPVPFAASLCAALDDGAAYVVSCENEELFAAAFTCESATPIETEGVIEKYNDNRTLMLMPQRFLISQEDCRGCPGIVAAFSRVCDRAMALGKTPAQPKRSTIVSSIERSLRNAFQRELVQLVKVLHTAGNERFTNDMINDLSERRIVKFNLDVPVDPEEEKKNEAPRGLSNTQKTADKPQYPLNSTSPAPAANLTTPPQQPPSPAEEKQPKQSPPGAIRPTASKQSIRKNSDILASFEDDDDFAMAPEPKKPKRTPPKKPVRKPPAAMGKGILIEDEDDYD